MSDQTCCDKNRSEQFICGQLRLEVDRLKAELEQTRVQLAGCGVAALCNTRESMEMHIVGHDAYGYSASYQSVLDVVGREINLREMNEALERQLAEAKKEAQNYKNVLIGQGFENLDSLAYETRDTTQIGVIAKQRTEQIIAQLAEARAEVEKLKRMTPTDAIAMRTSSVKQAHREGWEQAKAEAKMLSFSYSCHKDIAAATRKLEVN